MNLENWKQDQFVMMIEHSSLYTGNKLDFLFFVLHLHLHHHFISLSLSFTILIELFQEIKMLKITGNELILLRLDMVGQPGIQLYIFTFNKCNDFFIYQTMSANIYVENTYAVVIWMPNLTRGLSWIEVLVLTAFKVSLRLLCFYCWMIFGQSAFKIQTLFIKLHLEPFLEQNTVEIFWS